MKNSSHVKSIEVKILSKTLKVNCPTGKEEELYEAAQFLDKKMRDIRSAGRIIEVERIILIAALNLSHELLSLKRQIGLESKTIQNQIERLQNKIDNALIEEENG